LKRKKESREIQMDLDGVDSWEVELWTLVLKHIKIWENPFAIAVRFQDGHKGLRKKKKQGN
jgi:hypothetical protein